jgi:hypothetical protein
MHDFVSNLLSPQWWLSVVVVSIVLNVSSAYFKSALDKRLSTISARRRARLENERREDEETVAGLREDRHRQVLTAFHEMRLRQITVNYLLFGVGFLVLYLGVLSLKSALRPLVFSVLSVVTGLLYVQSVLLAARFRSAARRQLQRLTLAQLPPGEQGKPAGQ